MAGDGGWRPAFGFLAVAAGLVAGGLAWWWTSSSSADAGAAAAAASAPDVAPDVAPVRVASASAAVPAPMRVTAVAAASLPQAPRIVRQRPPGGDQTPDLADYVNEGDIPTTAEAIERLRRAGVTGGLAAFPPPGTRPALVGLAVPEDFVLPAGYVRHYQATDDGQRIEPILMFSPDFTFFDADHRPIAIPADRVVPPELAPPGLPIRRIVLPAPVDATRGAR